MLVTSIRANAACRITSPPVTGMSIVPLIRELCISSKGRDPFATGQEVMRDPRFLCWWLNMFLCSLRQMMLFGCSWIIGFMLLWCSWKIHGIADIAPAEIYNLIERRFGFMLIMFLWPRVTTVYYHIHIYIYIYVYTQIYEIECVLSNLPRLRS